MRLAAALFVLLLTPAVALAGGTIRVTFDQVGDCSLIQSWELVAASITPAKPDPAPADGSVVATFQNQAPVVCGPAAQVEGTTSVAGNTRFWLRAVASDGTKSAESNSVDRVVPLARPFVVDVTFP